MRSHAKQIRNCIVAWLAFISSSLVLLDASFHGAQSEGFLQHSLFFVVLVSERNLVLFELLRAQSKSLLQLPLLFGFSLALLLGTAKLSLSLLLGAAQLCLSLLFLAPQLLFSLKPGRLLSLASLLRCLLLHLPVQLLGVHHLLLVHVLVLLLRDSLAAAERTAKRVRRHHHIRVRRRVGLLQRAVLAVAVLHLELVGVPGVALVAEVGRSEAEERGD